MSKRRRARKENPEPPASVPAVAPVVRASRTKRIWAHIKAYWKSVGTLVALATLVLGYLNGRPAINYWIMFTEPPRANQLLAARGGIKNYGTQTARDLRFETQIKFAVPGERPRPDFNITIDYFGKSKTPGSPHDLAPGQEIGQVTGGPLSGAVLEPMRFVALMNGNLRFLVFSKITYKDVLSIQHTKYGCLRWFTDIKTSHLLGCLEQDWVAP